MKKKKHATKVNYHYQQKQVLLSLTINFENVCSFWKIQNLFMTHLQSCRFFIFLFVCFLLVWYYFYYSHDMKINVTWNFTLRIYPDCFYEVYPVHCGVRSISNQYNISVQYNQYNNQYYYFTCYVKYRTYMFMYSIHVQFYMKAFVIQRR